MLKWGVVWNLCVNLFLVKWHEEPESRQMVTFSIQNHLLWYQIDKIIKDLGFQWVSGKSVKFQILLIFLTGYHGDAQVLDHTSF